MTYEEFEKVIKPLFDSHQESLEKINNLLKDFEIRISLLENKKEPGNQYSNEVNIAKAKFSDIIRDSFLTLNEDEKEAGTTLEQKTARYEKWFKPMVDEVTDAIINSDKDIIKIITDFDLNKANHVKDNKWYTPEEAYWRDVQYKLLPELYEKVQDKIKAKYEENKTPYVVMYSSESPKFPSENKVYTLEEFNKILFDADAEFHNRKKYAEEKYGSADNYWDLERDDKLPEADKNIQFGYDKTNFKIFNIPNPDNKEDTFSYEPSRYDIGDGNGSVWNYIRSTCSHDDFIRAMDELERKSFNVSKKAIKDVDGILEMTCEQFFHKELPQAIDSLDNAQNEYKELHKKWLIESKEAEHVDKLLQDALNRIKTIYTDFVVSSFKQIKSNTKVSNKYACNEIMKRVVMKLYEPSRAAQKAMNAEDFKTYNSVDWAEIRRIWELFPANVNMFEWVESTALSNNIK